MVRCGLPYGAFLHITQPCSCLLDCAIRGRETAVFYPKTFGQETAGEDVDDVLPTVVKRGTDYLTSLRMIGDDDPELIPSPEHWSAMGYLGRPCYGLHSWALKRQSMAPMPRGPVVCPTSLGVAVLCSWPRYDSLSETSALTKEGPERWRAIADITELSFAVRCPVEAMARIGYRALWSAARFPALRSKTMLQD